MAHLNFLVLWLRPFFPRKTRVYVRQNATVSASLALGGVPGYTAFLYKLLYRRADRIICQTQAMALDLAACLGIEPLHTSRQIVVAPNPVDIRAIRAAVRRDLECGNRACAGPGPHLLAVGRLAREKGFDLLLRALLVVRREFTNADLAIVGAGSEDAALKRLAHDLKLDNATYFIGHVESPAIYFAEATAFILSSHQEGMPNALLEAAAAGLPLVVTPCSSGVEQLLEGKPGVWLANAITAEALAGAILDALRVLVPGQRFPHPFIEEHSLAHSIAAYEVLLDAGLEAESEVKRAHSSPERAR